MGLQVAVVSPDRRTPFRLLMLCLIWVISSGFQDASGFQEAQDQYEQALEAYRSNDYFEALAHSRRAVRAQPGNPFYLHICGLSWAALEQFSEAEEKLRRAIDLKPDEAAFHYDLGFIKVQQNEYSDAIDPLQKAVELNGDNLMARFLLGQALVMAHKSALIGDFSHRALEQFSTVAEKDPEFPSVHYYIGRIHVNEGRMEAARLEYEMELKYHPDNALALVDLAELLLNEGSAKESLSLLEKAKRLAPDIPNLHYVMSEVFDELDDQEKAIASASEAVRLDPNFAEAHYQLGLLYRKSGQLELAREELALFRKLKRSAPDPSGGR